MSEEFNEENVTMADIRIIGKMMSIAGCNQKNRYGLLELARR